jgi:signal transduction histidine kinase
MTSYLARWRRVPGTSLYLLTGFVLALVALVVVVALFAAGAALLVLVAGVPIVVGSLLAARAFGAADRAALRLSALPPILAPAAPPSDGAGVWRRMWAVLRDPHGWTALLHAVIVWPVLATVTFSIMITWWAGALGGPTYWFWSRFLPDDDDWGAVVADAVPWLFGGWAGSAVENVLYLVGGLVLAATMPLVIPALARAHHAAAAALVGRWASDDAVEEARAEASARASAVAAEDQSLRRLERDIHDGPQQRLVRLQFDLAALERRAASGDADAVATLARDAQGHAKAALDELRALASGVAPPLLQDRGLAAALEALAASATVPTRVDADEALDVSVAPEVARTAYFVAAELLTNTAKHAGASAATLSARVVDGRAGGRALEVRVADDGRGGAQPVPGHGLAGLGERVAGLRGTLTVDSPSGGPTDIRVLLPLTLARRPDDDIALSAR